MALVLQTFRWKGANRGSIKMEKVMNRGLLCEYCFKWDALGAVVMRLSRASN